MDYKAIIVIPKEQKINYKRVLGRIREHGRSTMAIAETAKELRIAIKTSDITALRASLNTITREIQVIEDSRSV